MLKSGLNSKTHWIIAAIIAAFVISFSFLLALKYTHFTLFNDFDLAVHAQPIWNMLQGSIFCSILGIGFLGNHASFISFLLVPFYAIFPSPITLLVIQTLVLGLSAYPLFLIAERLLSRPSALCIAILYLMYPGFLYTALFEFHPAAFATFFLAWMLYYFLREKFWKFCIFAVLAMLCQENIPLIVLMMGIVAFIERRSWRWVLYPFLGGLIYFLVCIYWLIPYYSGGKVNFFSLYAHLGRNLPDVLLNLIADPFKTFSLLTSPDRIEYIVMLFMPLCLIPLLGSKAMLPILPIFLQHMLSSRDFERSFVYHYTAEMIPFIFLAFILALRPVKSSGKILIPVLIMVFFCSSWLLIKGPYQKIAYILSETKDRYPFDIKREALSRISSKDSVVTTFPFLVHLTNRSELYSFQHVYDGYHPMSSIPFYLPDSVDHALIDFNESATFNKMATPDHYENLLNFMDQGWSAQEVWNSIVLFHKDGKDNKYPLFKIIPSEPKIERKFSVLVVDGVSFEGFNIGRVTKEVTKGNGVRIIPLHLNYRIYPTLAWKPGDWIQEEIYLQLEGAGVASGEYTLGMCFKDFLTNETIHGASLVLGRFKEFNK